MNPRRSLLLMTCAMTLAFTAGTAHAVPVPFPLTPVPGHATFSGSGVRALLVYGDTIYVGGNFRVTEGGVTRNNLAAFDFDGHLKAGFSPEPEAPNGTVRALATDGKSLFVGGTFGRMGLKKRLAAVDLTTGVVNRRFTAHVAGRLDPDTATGVFALAVVSDHSVEPAVTRLVVGGNFTRVNAPVDNHAGLVALKVDTGDVDATAFVDGVEGGPVIALLATADRVYAGGAFTLAQGHTSNLIAMNTTGVWQPGAFGSGAQPIVSLDIDETAGRLFAGIGGTGNRVQAYSVAGSNIGRTVWRGPRAGGDNQAVHVLGGNVYFGFHDGLFNQPDPYKMAALDEGTGVLEVDSAHAGLACSSATDEVGNCWLPVMDNTDGGQGFFGLWAIKHFVDPATGKARLVVGGEFTQIGGVDSSRRFAIFQEP
jgi:hypothetical protein